MRTKISLRCTLILILDPAPSNLTQHNIFSYHEGKEVL